MQANLVPPKPFYNHSIVFKACQVKQPKHLQGISPPEVQFWPGVHYWGSPSRMFWCNGDRTPYDGKHLYTKHDLVEDLAAGELIVKAIRCSELLSSADVGAERSRRLRRSNTPAEDAMDKYLDPAFQHVFAAVHQASVPKADWLGWLCQVLGMIPALPLNARGGVKLDHRGKGVSKPQKCACSREQFAKIQIRGLTSPDITLLWREHKHKHH